VGCSGGGARLVMCDLCTHYTLYCMCVTTSGQNWGTAAETDTIS